MLKGEKLKRILSGKNKVARPGVLAHQPPLTYNQAAHKSASCTRQHLNKRRGFTKLKKKSLEKK